jgi:hypothetical protein
MKLIKQSGRVYQDKEYFKYILVVPNKIIKKLGWKGGEDLNAKIDNDKITIEKS